MKISAPSKTESPGPYPKANRGHANITSEDNASTERALKQLASVTEDPKAADSLRQLASTIRPVSHWGLNE